MLRLVAVGSLVLGAAAAARAQEHSMAGRVAEVVDRGLQRTRREVQNLLEEELGAPRSTLEKREAELAARRGDLLRSFAAFARRGLQRHDTPHPVFHGCCDWHSAVHAHWALLRVMRATGDRGDVELIQRSLSPEGLRMEMEFLDPHPDFEMPYGRAWFLRMAIDYELLLGDGRVRRAADLIADSLFTYFRALPKTPWREDYESDSWGLAQLHAWYRHVRDGERLALVERWIQADFLRSKARLTPDEDMTRGGFFSRWGVWAYALCGAAGDDDLRTWYSAHPLTHADPVLAPMAVHHLGMDWSRAWAIGALARRLGDPSLRWAYLDHVEAGLAQRDRFAAQYFVYDHWVPQFAIYALTVDLDDK